MDFVLAGLPFTADDPLLWTTLDSSTLTGAAGPRTDLFVDPASGEAMLNAPRLLAPAPDGDFQLSACVSVEFASTYDAGALLLWAGDDTWTKLAYEYSPQGRGMVVSVVTRGRSDDANGYVVDNSAQLAGAESASTSAQLAGAESASTSAQLAGAESASNSVWLRIARVGEAYACHASIDGTRWDFVRHFTLGTTAAAIGFEVQSPLGEGCRAAFTDITFSPTTLTNLRDGS